MGKLELYYNTVKYLHGSQLLHQCLSRARKMVRKALGRKYSFSHYRAGADIALCEYIPKYESCRGDEFTFINLPCRFSGAWEYKELGPLWSFNINYMEYLLQPSMDFETGCKWIARFIESQHCNGIGMSPYCISLRCVNWIKFITKHRALLSADERKRIETSLYSQYLILRDNLEYNLEGNHLLENYFMLLWCALYFDDKELFAFASPRLAKELDRQTLADGANFEQSPMYHCIILDRVLDAVNLLKNNSTPDDGALLDFVYKKASAMLGWLQAICYADGTYPLFNDSAEGIAPTPAELFDYAARLGVEWARGTSDASGYYCVDGANYELRMDMGGIAASYIPGHAHADTFNFELRVGGRPFIVDSGISTYQWCGRRQHERSTAAHNTVTVNDDNSSRVWGAFRCAQRAEVFGLNVGENRISASHDGYSKYGTVHTRSFCWGDNGIEIKDTLSGAACGKAWFHFAPQTDLRIDGNCVHTTHGVLTFENHTSLELSDGEFSTEYNRLQPCKVLCVSFKGELGCCAKW